MDGERIAAFVSRGLESDEEYPEKITYTSVRDGTVTTQAATSVKKDGGLFSAEVLQSTLVVIYVPLCRMHDAFEPETCFHGSVVFLRNHHLWTKLLQHFDVLPNLLELLHGLDGGVMSFTSYARPTEPSNSPRDDATAGSSSRPVAFHTAYDPGGQLNGTSAIYSRCDLLTSRSLILVLGLDCEISYNENDDAPYNRVRRRLFAQPDAHAFEIIAVLQKMHYDHNQSVRLYTANMTEKMERITGVGVGAGSDPSERLALQKYTFCDSLYGCAADMRSGIRLVSNLVSNCQAFSAHTVRLQSLCAGLGTSSGMNAVTLQKLLETTDLTSSLLQSQGAGFKNMQSRLHAQIDMQRALMAERDTDTAVRDSQLVRGIAFVTMVFLPATFVATLFSMVFFEVDDSRDFHLKVDRCFWIYPAITLPLTVVVMLAYGLWSSGWSWWKTPECAQVDEASTDDGKSTRSTSPPRQSLDATEGAYRPITEIVC